MSEQAPSGPLEGETAYEWFDGTTVFQRKCDGCEGGLLYAPARFHPACQGSGYLLRFPSVNGGDAS